MNWTREYGDGTDSRGWLVAKTPVGDLYIEDCQWASKPGRPYSVSWWPFNTASSDNVQIGCAASEAGGKRMAAAYLKRMAAKFAEVANG